jgi:hypothetical protein
MSLSELTLNKLPQVSSKQMQRKLQRMQTRLNKATHRRVVKSQRAVLRWQSRQFYLTTAIRDSRLAISRNEDIFLGVVLLSIMLGYAFSDSAASLLLFCFQAISAGSDATGMSIGLLSLMAVGVLATACVWLIAFILNGLSLAQMDGANGKRHISLRATMRRSLALTSRVSTAWVLLGLISGFIVSLIGTPIAVYYYLHYLYTSPSLGLRT